MTVRQVFYQATVRELVEHCWRLVDAERKRWFK